MLLKHLILTAGALLCLSSVSLARAESTAKNRIHQVCSEYGVPYGWAILSIDNNAFGCSGGARYTIQSMDTQTFMEVCSNTWLPPDWVVVNASADSSTCGQYNRLTIERIEGPYWPLVEH